MEDADICDFATAIVEFNGESGYAIVSIDADAAAPASPRGVKDPQQHLWYYRSLLDVYSNRVDNWVVDELREVVDALEREVGRSA